MACACVSAQPCQGMPLSRNSLPAIVHSRKPKPVSADIERFGSCDSSPWFAGRRASGSSGHQSLGNAQARPRGSVVVFPGCRGKAQGANVFSTLPAASSASQRTSPLRLAARWIGHADLERQLLACLPMACRRHRPRSRTGRRTRQAWPGFPTRDGSRSGRPDPGSHRRRTSSAGSTFAAASSGRSGLAE